MLVTALDPVEVRHHPVPVEGRRDDVREGVALGSRPRVLVAVADELLGLENVNDVIGRYLPVHGMGSQGLDARGVRIVGTDGWSWDAPFVHTKVRVAATGDASLIWEGHRAGMEIGYCHLEKLHNLEALPATGFLVSCFPFNIKGASAGFTRAVAILED